MLSSFGRRFGAPVVAAMSVAFVSASESPAATRIERVVSPGGIEAWLVREPAVPLIAFEFAFKGGATHDVAGKEGTANLVSGLLDEGAGDLDAAAFHDRLDAKAIELRFSASHDNLRGSLKTLVENRDEAFELLALAVNRPRFDAEPLERVRQQVLAGIRRKSTSPNTLASEMWWATAFPGHPYGRPVEGSADSVAAVGADDLKAFVGKVVSRDTLKVAVVGDIDAATLAQLLDRVFAGLPKTGQPVAVADAVPQGLGQRQVVELDVPQSVLTFGWPGLLRSDPDFMPAFVLNHILGGGTLSSRLYQEVREKRGLAYSVYSYLMSMDHAGLILGGVSTRNDRAAESLAVIEREVGRLGKDGPSAEELDKAKKYLIGSYALRFDTSGKIAAQLLQIQLDELGIDYIDRRNDLVAAVTLEDVRRVAGRLLLQDMLVTTVGRPVGLGNVGQGG
ncbi:Peptidase M16 inactive domain protein [Blastochloris viridis]|uniref:Peptidase M16 inactive domain protein n=1 Tax=Blastochloris viridis TaxID=1079 RepID=A0A0S4Q3H4_BLAVI|nr:Peptidase M16 inactive domain protein [Blastochloris viridis]